MPGTDLVRRVARRGQREVAGRGRASEICRLLKEAPAGSAATARFGAFDDDLWLWAQTEGRRRVPELASYLPPLPPDDVQRRFTGLAGTAALSEAWAFWRLVRVEAARRGRPIGTATTVLDFGCGWGRISRFFLRDLEVGGLTGLDVLPGAIERSAGALPWFRFLQVGTTPPSPLPDASVDVAYAYSVFSHLSEPSHLAWLSELARVLRPGGVAVLTTRASSFIDHCESLRRVTGPAPEHAERSVAAFADGAHWRARYAAGGFCYDPGAGGALLDGATYGEALIPRSYAERAWAEVLPLVAWLPATAEINQDVLVAQKPALPAVAP